MNLRRHENLISYLPLRFYDQNVYIFPTCAVELFYLVLIYLIVLLRSSNYGSHYVLISILLSYPTS
jgi:hypothetical protein